MSGGQPPDPKWQQIYDRMVERARELLDDPPALQSAIDAADVRAEGSANSVTIWRLFAGWCSPTRKGSYRDASKTELLRAIAAICYVGSPLDLIPDHLPRGLKDDASFVRYIKGRLSKPLDAYAAWEHSLDPLEAGQTEVLEPPLPASAGEMEIAVLERDDSVLAGSGSALTPPPIAVQQLAQSSKASATPSTAAR